MNVLLLTVFGLLFGSFINALVWRLHEGKDWVGGRSECPRCGHLLAPKDLIPVLSFLWLRGKCRYCKKPIDDTPFAELLLPVWFVVSYLFWPYGLTGGGLFQFFAWLVCGIVFVALIIYDKRWFLLPDKMVYPLTLAAFAILLVRVAVYHEPSSIILDAALAALVISGSFYLLFQVSKGTWIGGGDVKLGLALGLFAGTPLRGLLVLFVASLAGTLVMLPSLLKGKANRKAQIPFGPFLIIGMFVVVLWGHKILGWYLGLLTLE